MQAELRDGVPRIIAKRELHADEDVWIVPHAINASRPTLHAMLEEDADMRMALTELVAAPLDTSGVQEGELL